MSKAFIPDESVKWEAADASIQRKVMAFNEQLMLVKVKFRKGDIGSLHHHIHTQISYVASGVFEVEINHEKSVLKAGDVFYVSPETIHGVVCLEDGILIDVFNPMRADFV